MKVTLICGSPAKHSHTHALLIYIHELLQKEQVDVVFWDLESKPLPTVIPEYHRNPIETPNTTTKEFIQLITSSDALVLGTPLYHGSYSGILKSALDNLGSTGFKNKLVGLVSNASTMRSSQALEHLRSVVRTLYGYPTQTQVATMNSDYREENKEYILENEDIKKRAQRLVHEVLHLAKLF